MNNRAAKQLRRLAKALSSPKPWANYEQVSQGATSTTVLADCGKQLYKGLKVNYKRVQRKDKHALETLSKVRGGSGR